MKQAAPIPRARSGRRLSVPGAPGALRGLVLIAALVAALAYPRGACAHGDLELRIAEFTRQIEAATNNPAGLYLERGELEREHGMGEAAGADFERAAQHDPGLPGVDRCRGRLLADRGQLEAAQAMFDRALQHDHNDGESFIGRARVLARRGQREAAIADYWRGLERLPEPQPDYVGELARALVAEGQVAEALRALDAGIKKLGPIVPLQGYALDLELGRKNTNAALARLETILARAFRKESWFARRGDILRDAGRLAEARKSYEAALASVSRLPGRLQQSPGMVKLQAQVNAALAGITNAPAAAPSK